MRATSCRIENIATLEEVEIELGQVTTVEGRNGEGKSSVLDAVKSAFGGGTDATLLTVGAEQGRVCLLLSDGTKVTREFKPGKSSLRVDHPDFGRLNKPQSFVETLADLAAVNPVSFLMMPPKKRAEYLLEVCPIEVSALVVSEILDGVELPPGEYAKGTEGGSLEMLDSIRKSIFNLRTSTNGAAKEKRATVAQLAESLPKGQSEDVEEELARVEAETTEHDNKVAAELNVLRVAIMDAQDRYVDRRQTEKAELFETAYQAQDAIEREIEELQSKLTDMRLAAQKRSAEFEAETLRVRTEMVDTYKTRVEEAKAAAAPVRDELRSRVTRLQEAARHAAGHAKTREIVATMTEEAARLEGRSEAMTEAIARLDAYRTSLLASLPIPGLEVRDGEIYREGVPFDRLNMAQRITIACEIAKLRLGDLRLMVVDGVECLDSESLVHLEKWAAMNDVQLLLAKVTDGELSVRSDAEEVVA